MPERTYMVVDPRRDHSIRVPRPDLSMTLGTPNACTDCHKDQSAQWAADAMERWYGPDRFATPHFGQALHEGRQGGPGAAAALIELATNGEQPGIARASALSLLRDMPSARSIIAVEAGLRDADPIVRLHALEALEMAAPEQRWRLARTLLDDPVRTVRAEAGRVLAPVMATTIINTADRQRLQAALDEYVECQMASAERPESHLNIGLVNLMAQQFARAEHAYRAALSIDPAFVPASVNLADLMRERGRDDEGEVVLRDALAVTPDAAAVHHALGLLLIRRNRLAEAIESLQRGATLAPEAPQYAFAFALALDAVGETPVAIEVLNEASRLHPWNRDLLAALESMHRATGNVAAADDYARRLAELDGQRP
jgi:tetratricopeptide (TPR) repeat protein